MTARIDDLATAIDVWRALDRTTAEARLFPLAQFMVDVYAAALLLEQAGWEETELGTDRKQVVARLFVREHLADRGPARGIDAPAEELQRFKDLVDGAFVDEQRQPSTISASTMSDSSSAGNEPSGSRRCTHPGSAPRRRWPPARNGAAPRRSGVPVR